MPVWSETRDEDEDDETAALYPGRGGEELNEELDEEGNEELDEDEDSDESDDEELDEEHE
jgi:hypothetical protein